MGLYMSVIVRRQEQVLSAGKGDLSVGEMPTNFMWYLATSVYTAIKEWTTSTNNPITKDLFLKSHSKRCFCSVCLLHFRQ